MRYETCETCGTVETVGEPPAGLPAAAAVRVYGEIEVDVDGREERVVEAREAALVRHRVDLLLDDELVVEVLVEHAEVLVAVLALVHDHLELALLALGERVEVLETEEVVAVEVAEAVLVHTRLEVEVDRTLGLGVAFHEHRPAACRHVAVHIDRLGARARLDLVNAVCSEAHAKVRAAVTVAILVQAKNTITIAIRCRRSARTVAKTPNAHLIPCF